jgi:RNA polymerase sigma-70 factor (ECF subfamily)
VDKSEENRLVRQLTRMDEAAWRRFCRLYTQPLYAFVRYALGLDHQKTEEVVQMALIRCVRSIGTFDPRRGDLLDWLKAVARNESHTLIRQDGNRPAQRPQSSFPRAVVEQILQTLDKAELPEEILARRDLQLLVQEALLSLAERQREVLIMKYVQENKVAEIAARLHTSEKAVESLLSRARDAFRTVFRRRVSRTGAMQEVEIR